MRDQWGDEQAANTVAIDAMDQVWVVANHDGPTLVRLDRSLTNVTLGNPPIPRLFSLSQNYPNPFNPSTTIRFSVPTKTRVHLTVFNLLGQQVAELANKEMGAGSFERIWNANVSSGLYFYRLEAIFVNDPSQRFAEVKKMILLK
jgi:hypothetical protein